MSASGRRGQDRSASEQRVPSPPEGRERLKWLGPAFIWMLSAAGSGELLFTPRVAALYGYTLLWALLLAVVFKWFINREVGRYTVCTGKSILTGFADLPGPKNWALWLILLPQAVVAVATVAGLTGAAATAGVLLLGGTAQVWMIGITVLTALVILLGQYQAVERVSSILAVVLTSAILAAAISVLPDLARLGSGLLPSVPGDVNFGEVLPWLGFALAGAAGLMWFSYWLQARGYGAAGEDDPPDPRDLDEEGQQKLRSWLHSMTIANTLAVVGALIIAIAFLILGAELLQPEGIVPQESETARVLGRLLGGVWGPIGFWFMIGAVLVTLTSTTLSDQDGFGRMFAGGTRRLTRGFGLSGRWADRTFLQRAFVIVLLAALPISVYLLFGEPIGLLQLAGAIEAAHIPVVAVLTLLANRRALPRALQPTRLSFWGTVVSAAFFAVFAVVYLLQLFGVIILGGSGTTNQATAVSVTRVTQDPRAFLNAPLVTSGRVAQPLGANAFTLTGMDGSGRSSQREARPLLVVRADAARELPGLTNADAARAFVGEQVHVAGTLVVFELARLEAALGVDLDDERLARFEGQPALLAFVTQPHDQKQSGERP